MREDGSGVRSPAFARLDGDNKRNAFIQEVVAMRVVGLGMVCLGAAALWAGPASQARARDNVEEARALSARIGHYIDIRWAADKITAAATSSDAEFFRRISLDLTGRIPTLTDMRDFIDDDRPDKRWIWAEELLNKRPLKDNPSDAPKPTFYAAHFAAVWRETMLPQSSNPQVQVYAASLEAWLRGRLDKNVGYDKIARELITAPVNGGVDDGFGRMGQNTAGPGVYFQANELKPESLAANTSRLFLGHKLECAQCHNHPFAKWTRKQFWEYAAFFGGINPQGGDQPNAKEIKITGTDKTVEARFLDGTDPKWQDGKTTRAVLADWITRRENPYFARATVNKVWAYFFGIGLIYPLDEPSDENPPSHPELLDELAKEFASHDFDLKYLIRGIVASKAYQLSSVASHPSQVKHPRSFARMTVRGMSPEQLFDSVCVAIDFKDNSLPNMMNMGFNPYNPQSPRAQFLARFANQERRNEMETSILQALFMMNGKFMAEATSLKNNKNLALIADFSEKNLPTSIEQVYLVTLSRLPTKPESARMIKYVGARQKAGHGKKAYEDMLWALMNSAEFMLNH
jgi:hypothetical protein